MSRRLGLAGIALFFAVNGCGSQPAPKVVETATPVAPEVKPPEPAPGSADAVAQQTQRYAKQMEALLAQRAAARPQATPENTPEIQMPTTWPSKASSGWEDLDPAYRPTTRPVETARSDRRERVGWVANQHADSVRLANIREPVTQPAAGDALEQRITRQSREQTRDVAAQLDYQLLSLLREENTPQAESLAGLANEDRETLSALMDSINNFRNGVRNDPNMISSLKLRPLLELSDRLHGQSDLRIPTLTLCTRVDGFGNYEPFESLKFAAGKDHQAIVYCEVENFASQLNDQHLWETKLTQEVVLWTEGGDPVWKDKSRPIKDLARNRRHDFYLIRKITLPTTLGVNRYLLKVTIVDQAANRVAESTVPISIVVE